LNADWADQADLKADFCFCLFRVVSCGLVVPVFIVEELEPRTYTKKHEMNEESNKLHETRKPSSFRSAQIRLIRPIRVQKTLPVLLKSDNPKSKI
jgi:hypothetical protein